MVFQTGDGATRVPGDVSKQFLGMTNDGITKQFCFPLQLFMIRRLGNGNMGKLIGIALIAFQSVCTTR